MRCPGFSGQPALRSLVERKAGVVSQGRTYKPEFKQMAVEMVLEGGKSVAKVAEELDINEWTLRNWVKQARKAQRTTSDVAESESPDLLRAERRIRELEMEVAFLKKAAAYFAKEQP